MLPNAFIGKPKQPTEDEVTAELGTTKPLWDQLIADLAKEQNVDVQEWNSYSPKAGWALRLKHKDRNSVYLSPSQGCFMVSFALGDKAMKAARRCKLPQRIMKVLAEAPRYAEGTAVRLEVKGPKDIAVVKKLAVVKLES
jgi:hypothetical protein